MKEITVSGMWRGTSTLVGYMYEATEEDNKQCYFDISEESKKSKHVQIFTGEATIFKFIFFMGVLRQSLEKGKPRVQVFCYNPELDENIVKSQIIKNASDFDLVNKAIEKGVLEVFLTKEPIKQQFALIGNSTLWIQRVQHKLEPGKPKSMWLLKNAKDVMQEYKEEARQIKDKIIGKITKLR